jgi:hypothetical protein
MDRTMGRGLTWELATTALAVYAPDRHVCVSPSRFKAQAHILSVTIPGSKRPTAAHYHHFVALAQDVAGRLQEEGLAPQDLIDVCDFMRVSSGTPARRKLAYLRSKEAAARARDDSDQEEAAA